MTCAEVDDRLDAWLHGTLSDADGRALDEHLAACTACRAYVDDVRTLQREARLIGLEGPSPAAWDRIAGRLAERTATERPRTDTRPPTARPVRWHWLAVAALLAVIVGGSLWVLRQSLFRAAPVPQAAANTNPNTNGASPALVESISTELDQAAQHYERAIAGLEQVASESASPLDPAVTQMLRENLRIIDQAINDSRDALQAEPDSQLAQESLFDGFRRKVGLLQDTIALMNEMRKGNQAGAAAIASGLNKG